jgi:hypothetical protein
MGRTTHRWLRLCLVRIEYLRGLVVRSADLGLSAWELACHALPIIVFAAKRLFALSVSARYGPSQTVPSGTQGARPANDRDRRNTVKGRLTLTSNYRMTSLEDRLRPFRTDVLIRMRWSQAFD